MWVDLAFQVVGPNFGTDAEMMTKSQLESGL